MEISFDDLLPESPKTKTSVKIHNPTIASKPYRHPEFEETRANWRSPKPEAIILFWTETWCSNCGQTHCHPTYEKNSVLVRYRVSRFRTLLRPYTPANAMAYRSLPRVRETTESSVNYCSNCFNEHFDNLEAFSDQLQLFPELDQKPIDLSCSEAIKPFAEVDYTDAELHTKK